MRRTSIELSLALDKAFGVLGVNEEDDSGDLGEVLHGECQPVVLRLWMRNDSRPSTSVLPAGDLFTDSNSVVFLPCSFVLMS